MEVKLADFDTADLLDELLCRWVDPETDLVRLLETLSWAGVPPELLQPLEDYFDQPMANAIRLTAWQEWCAAGSSRIAASPLSPFPAPIPR